LANNPFSIARLSAQGSLCQDRVDSTTWLENVFAEVSEFPTTFRAPGLRNCAHLGGSALRNVNGSCGNRVLNVTCLFRSIFAQHQGEKFVCEATYRNTFTHSYSSLLFLRARTCAASSFLFAATANAAGCLCRCVQVNREAFLLRPAESEGFFARATRDKGARKNGRTPSSVILGHDASERRLNCCRLLDDARCASPASVTDSHANKSISVTDAAVFMDKERKQASSALVMARQTEVRGR
jgi:hypothetical protein